MLLGFWCTHTHGRQAGIAPFPASLIKDDARAKGAPRSRGSGAGLQGAAARGSGLRGNVWSGRLHFPTRDQQSVVWSWSPFSESLRLRARLLVQSAPVLTPMDAGAAGSSLAACDALELLPPDLWTCALENLDEKRDIVHAAACCRCSRRKREGHAIRALSPCAHALSSPALWAHAPTKGHMQGARGAQVQCVTPPPPPLPHACPSPHAPTNLPHAQVPGAAGGRWHHADFTDFTCTLLEDPRA
jgi:hypothetical protein